MHTAPQNTPATVITIASFPPKSSEGSMSPKIEADSMIPAAKARTMSLNLWEMCLKAKPIMAPNTVAPPTPSYRHKLPHKNQLSI